MVRHVDGDRRALRDLERRAGDRAVVGQHPHRRVADPLLDRHDLELELVAVGELDELCLPSLGQPSVSRENSIVWVSPCELESCITSSFRLRELARKAPAPAVLLPASDHSFACREGNRPPTTCPPRRTTSPEAYSSSSFTIVILRITWDSWRTVRGVWARRTSTRRGLVSVWARLVPTRHPRTEGFDSGVRAAGRRPSGSAGEVRDFWSPVTLPHGQRSADRAVSTTWVIAALANPANVSSSSSASCVAPATVRWMLFVESSGELVLGGCPAAHLADAGADDGERLAVEGVQSLRFVEDRRQLQELDPVGAQLARRGVEAAGGVAGLRRQGAVPAPQHHPSRLPCVRPSA